MPIQGRLQVISYLHEINICFNNNMKRLLKIICDFYLTIRLRRWCRFGEKYVSVNSSPPAVTWMNLDEIRYLQLDKQIKHADSYVLVSVFLFNAFI